MGHLHEVRLARDRTDELGHADQLREEVYIAKGRILVRGRMTKGAPEKVAGYSRHAIASRPTSARRWDAPPLGAAHK